MGFISSASQNTGSVTSDPGLSAIFDIGSRTNGVLWIGVYGQAGADIGDWVTPTWNGVAMQAGPVFNDGNRFLGTFYLAAPANGSNTFNVTWSNIGVNIPSTAAFAIWMDSMDQTTPLHKSNSASGSTDPAIPLTGANAPTINGCTLIGFWISEANNPLTAVLGTVAQQIDFGPRVAGAAYYEQATAEEVTLQYTGEDQTWGAVALAFAPLAAGGNPPTIQADTPDEQVFSSATPRLEFTGTDPDGDDLAYQIQVTDNPDAFAGGSTLEDNFSGGGGGSFHAQPHASASTADGEVQVDDRMGQSFTAKGGILDKIILPLTDFRTETDGTAFVRVYEHAGVFGTSSAPLNAADPADTPTPGALAISDGVALLGEETPGDFEFTFSGANRIRLTPGANYVLVFDWQPNDRVTENTFAVTGDVLNSGSLHDGNVYNDGFVEANNGVEATWDLHFEVHESFTLVDAISDANAGFANLDNGADTDPFTSADQIGYTMQSALEEGVTYYWQARVKDPGDTDTFSAYTTMRSFTIDLGAGGGTILPLLNHYMN